MNQDLRTIALVRAALEHSAQTEGTKVQIRLDDIVAKAVAAHAAKHGALASGKVPTPAKKPISLVQNLGHTLSNWLALPGVSFALSLAFIAGTVMSVVEVGQHHYENQVSEVVDLDAGILTDDLPPDAYLDSSFVGYSKNYNQISVPAELDPELPAGDEILLRSEPQS